MSIPFAFFPVKLFFSALTRAVTGLLWKEYEEPSEGPWEPLADPDEKRYKETGLICPDCGQALVEKMINGSSCWYHIDGYKNDATCRRIFNSVAEIKGYEGEKKKSEDKKLMRRDVGTTFPDGIFNTKLALGLVPYS